MNLRNTLARGLILPVLCAFWTQVAEAAAAPKTYTYDGTVANACSLSNTSVGLTVSRAMGGITISFSPTSNPIASCNTAAGGVLSVTSTRLVRQSNGVAQDYTLRVTGWNGNMDYTTAAVAPTATKASKAGLGASTLTLTCQAGCTTSQINQNATYTATITLGLAANP